MFRYLEVDGVDEDQDCGGIQGPFWQSILDPVLCLVGNPVIDGVPCFLRVLLQHKTSFISVPAVRCLSLHKELQHYLEVERQQFGSVHSLTDVLIRLVEGQRFVPKQSVGRDQLGGLVLLPV